MAAAHAQPRRVRAQPVPAQPGRDAVHRRLRPLRHDHDGDARPAGRATSAARSAPGKRIWLTEFGYQTNPPDPYLGVSQAKQALYIGEAALRAYLAPRVDMLIQFLIQDEPELDRWQSGVLTAQRADEAVVRGAADPARARCRAPAARTTLWGQVRPGAARGATASSSSATAAGRRSAARRARRPAGYFTRVVSAGAGAQFRVVDATTGTRSPALVVV